jgi:hypothetical protein
LRGSAGHNTDTDYVRQRCTAANAVIYELNVRSNMQKELEDILVKKYPVLYSSMNINKLEPGKFACDDGWFLLVDTLSELIAARSTLIKVMTIKKKYGRLHFYVSDYETEYRDFIHGAIEMACLLSEIVCEKCSEKGEMFNINSLAARCCAHRGPKFPFIKLTRNKRSLPFNINIGSMWHEMVKKLYLYTQDNRKKNDMPEIIFTEIAKTNGELCINYVNGDQIIEGMISFLLAYASKIDEESGGVI